MRTWRVHVLKHALLPEFPIVFQVGQATSVYVFILSCMPSRSQGKAPFKTSARTAPRYVVSSGVTH